MATAYIRKYDLKANYQIKKMVLFTKFRHLLKYGSICVFTYCFYYYIYLKIFNFDSSESGYFYIHWLFSRYFSIFVNIMLFAFFPTDNGTVPVGLRGVHKIGHDCPGMGRRSANLASLLGNVRFDICVDRGDSRAFPVVLCRLSRDHAAAVSREYS